jgi:hypothetical protein
MGVAEAYYKNNLIQSISQIPADIKEAAGFDMQ